MTAVPTWHSPTVSRRAARLRTAVRQFRQRAARPESVRDWVRTRFEIDTRSLAALRIALGLVILVDLVHRATALELFYTDAGVYPVAAYEGTYRRFTGLSIHAASGELWFQQLLFVVAGAFALALVAGYRTRLVGLVSLALLFSLHARNPAVLNGADRLLRVLLFVALFTPLGERWSIDALRRGSARSTVVGTTAAALLVQPVVVFTSNALLKSAGTTWYTGRGVAVAMANDVMTVHLGNYLSSYPTVLVALNWAWVTLLAGSVVFLLLTTGRLRAFFVLAYIGAFAGMLATMMVGLFPLVLTAAVIPYLPAPSWNAVAQVWPGRIGVPRPTAARLGPLGRPPVERRLLDALDERGYGSAAAAVRRTARATLTVAGVLLLAWMLVFSASHIAGVAVPEPIDSDHLDEQRWGLYTPNPARSYSWFVVEAEVESGATVDAFGEGSVDRSRPADAARKYETFRHRKFMESVSASGSGSYDGLVATSYADWACERANANHDGRVERVTVYELVQPSPIDGEYEPIDERTLIVRECDG